MFFIKLLSPPNGLVADPFGGSGTTGIAALVAERNCVLIDNNHEYCCAAHQRLLIEAGASPATEVLQETLYGRAEMVKHLVVKETDMTQTNNRKGQRPDDDNP